MAVDASDPLMGFAPDDPPATGDGAAEMLGFDAADLEDDFEAEMEVELEEDDDEAAAATTEPAAVGPAGDIGVATTGVAAAVSRVGRGKEPAAPPSVSSYTVEGSSEEDRLKKRERTSRAKAVLFIELNTGSGTLSAAVHDSGMEHGHSSARRSGFWRHGPPEY